jgi:hypothetical protein
MSRTWFLGLELRKYQGILTSIEKLSILGSEGCQLANLQHRKQLLDILSEYSIDLQPASIGNTEYKTDGHAFAKNHPRLIVEAKNEIGWKGAEPSL